MPSTFYLSPKPAFAYPLLSFSPSVSFFVFYFPSWLSSTFFLYVSSILFTFSSLSLFAHVCFIVIIIILFFFLYLLSAFSAYFSTFFFLFCFYYHILTLKVKTQTLKLGPLYYIMTTQSIENLIQIHSKCNILLHKISDKK